MPVVPLWNALLGGAIGGGRRERGAEERAGRIGLKVAGADLEMLLAILGADGDRQRLGEAGLIFPGEIEVDQIWP